MVVDAWARSMKCMMMPLRSVSEKGKTNYGGSHFIHRVLRRVCSPFDPYVMFAARRAEQIVMADHQVTCRLTMVISPKSPGVGDIGDMEQPSRGADQTSEKKLEANSHVSYAYMVLQQVRFESHLPREPTKSKKLADCRWNGYMRSLMDPTQGLELGQ